MSIPLTVLTLVHLDHLRQLSQTTRLIHLVSHQPDRRLDSFYLYPPQF